MSRYDPDRPVIHWFSPLPPAATDIAHYTARILPALARECRVILWTDAPDWDAALGEYALVQTFDADTLTPEQLRRAARKVGATPSAAQVSFIHIGNTWVFHGTLLRLAQRLASVIVLHDTAIQELIAGALHRGMLRPSWYKGAMAETYGDAGTHAAAACLRDLGQAPKVATDMPGFALAMEEATSVIVHTPAAADAVKSWGKVPVRMLELPFAPGAQPVPARRPRLGPLRLVQFGHISRNRRLEEVLRALAELKSEVDFRFDVMGTVWHPARITALIDALGLRDRVTLHGFVSEATLDDALRLAHLVINLRHPTVGEASGSQLRIWASGAASVVRRAGWSATVPEGAVFFLPDETEEEAASLQTLIRNLANDRSLGDAVGQAGHARLLAAHHPETYAKAIADIARGTGTDAAQTLYAPSLKDSVL